METHIDELAAPESWITVCCDLAHQLVREAHGVLGKIFSSSENLDVVGSIGTIRYYAGWADKIQGKTIETDENKLAYTHHEPIPVVG